jgi:superfamily II DNA/RNA helicase
LDPFGNKETTPKMQQMVHDLKHGIKHDPNFKSITFSNYLGAGLKPFSSQLKRENIRHAMFTGAESQDERTKLLKQYNTGKIRHLLVSPAGMEGIDLHGTKLVQKMEPDWNPQRSNQAIGRAARFKSHEMLPENERHVDVKSYMSDPRLGLWGKVKRFFNPDVHGRGIDEYVQARATEKETLNEAFLKKLQEIH